MAERLAQPLIRQGWVRAIVFFMVYVLGAAGVATLLHPLFPSKETVQKTTDPAAAQQVALLWGVLVITIFSLGAVWFFRRLIDKRTMYSLGFAWDGASSVLGAMAAMAMLGLGTLLLIAIGHLWFAAWNGGLGYLGINLLLMVLVGCGEELVFRGYLLHNLLQSLNKWRALAVSALLFTFIHLGNEGTGVLPMIEIFIAGMMLGINYIFTQNLWFGITLHVTWNFLQGPVLGYEVSGNSLPALMQQQISGPAWLTGGAFGFEGSVLAMMLNLGLIALLTRHYRHLQPADPTA